MKDITEVDYVCSVHVTLFIVALVIGYIYYRDFPLNLIAFIPNLTWSILMIVDATKSRLAYKLE